MDALMHHLTMIALRKLCCLLLLVSETLSFSPLESKKKCYEDVINELQQLTSTTKQSIHHRDTITRRSWLAAAVTTPVLATAILPAWAVPPSIEGIGGGADIRTPLSASVPDVVYPNSIEGVWQYQRIVTLVEGNTEQALVAWKALGGSDDSLFTKQKVEPYLTKFLFNQNGTTVVDRGFEIGSRSSSKDVQWDAAMPNTLSYNDSKGQSIELAVIQRRTEPPTDQGFGFNELVRITTPATFGEVQRCAQVKRRYRRAFDDQGNRVVEGLEIVKTFRVLDGVAGVEMPTSTTKSQLKLTRPPKAS